MAEKAVDAVAVTTSDAAFLALVTVMTGASPAAQKGKSAALISATAEPVIRTAMEISCSAIPSSSAPQKMTLAKLEILGSSRLRLYRHT